MDDGSNNELAGYYTINFDKFIELVRQTEAIYNIVSDLLQDYIMGVYPDQWETSPVPELAGYYVAAYELKTFLDEIVNNPTEEEIRLTTKHKITDVLISLEDLAFLNSLVAVLQEYEKKLYQAYKIPTLIQ
jgi:hypothetical protein